jgi:hypothetical protein
MSLVPDLVSKLMIPIARPNSAFMPVVSTVNSLIASIDPNGSARVRACRP